MFGAVPYLFILFRIIKTFIKYISWFLKMPKSLKAKKKMKFKGNRFTKNNKLDDKTMQFEKPCSSERKLKNKKCSSSFSNNDDYNILINFSILQNELVKFIFCPKCRKTVTLSNNFQKRKGFSYLLCLNCTNCDWKYEFQTSQKTNKLTLGKAVSCINYQMVIAFREIGQGYQGIRTFANIMNMPTPLSFPGYQLINNKLHTFYNDAASESMSNAALETKSLLATNTFDNSITNCQVSVDGTWQKRGYSSMNGVVTFISRENGKCLDTAVLSKYCKGCAMWKGKKNKPGYLNWQTNHICQANHKKSSGSMEAAGAILMFSRPIKNYGLRYTSYIGDGDTSSFNEVKSSKPYGEEITIEKLECVGHVQKRLGTRCRSLLQSMKRKILSDGKKLNGAGRLTDNVINKLQNYYGMAIRQNKLLYPMKFGLFGLCYFIIVV